MPLNLFISYAHVDKYLVKGILDVISDSGYNTWIDNQLIGGQNWQQQLYEAIQKCDAFIYIITPEATNSEWCRWEVNQAVKLKKTIIPLLLQSGTLLLKEIQDIQYIDFSEGATGAAVARLTRALREIEKASDIGNTPVLTNSDQKISQFVIPEKTYVKSDNRVRKKQIFGSFMLIALLVIIIILVLTIPNKLDTMGEKDVVDALTTQTHDFIPTTLGIENDDDITNTTAATTSSYFLAVSYFTEGNTYFRIFQYDKALTAYNQAIELEPNNPMLAGAYLGRGNIYLEKGKREDARSEYHQAIAVNPQYADAYRALGHLYFDEYNFEKALEYYKHYVEILGDDADPSIRSRILILEENLQNQE